MNILAITQSADILGGANRSFLDVITGLKNQYHHSITVLVPSDGEMCQRLKERDIPYIVTTFFQTSFVKMGEWGDAYRSIRDTIFYLKNFCVLNNVCKAVKTIGVQFDVVYINDTTNTIGFWISKKLSVPFVWHCRGYQLTIKKYLLFERRLIKHSNGIFICISKAMANYFSSVRGIPDKKITVVYNGIPNNCSQIDSLWINTIKDEIHCIQCGHLSPAKGQIDSIRALIELRKRGHNNILLYLAGTPGIVHGKDYSIVLREIVEENNLEKNVVFLGEVSNMKELRSSMHIELVCSVCEPFGRVTVEGMQAGLVVIGADTGATPEIIDDGNTGLLYKQGNYYDLADKIESVISDMSLGNLLAFNARSFSQSHFTLEENLTNINTVLSSVVKSNKQI